jgi:hypothetical protein
MHISLRKNLKLFTEICSNSRKFKKKKRPAITENHYFILRVFYGPMIGLHCGFASILPSELGNIIRRDGYLKQRDPLLMNELSRILPILFANQ